MTKKPEHHTAESDGNATALERIVFFSDAVFAIAITLLALEIRVPELSGDLAVELPKALIETLPRILSFIIGFLVIPLYWTAHHRMFRMIKRFDNGLIWYNLYMLMLIAFMPIPTALLGEYGDQPIVAIIYAVVVILVSTTEWLMWRHASQQHRLVDPDLSARQIRYFELRTLAPLAVFALSIPVALIFGAPLAELMWALIWVAARIVSERFKDVAI